MGTSHNASQLVAKINAAGRELADSKGAMQKVGMFAKLTFLSEAGGAGVGKGFGKTKVSRSISAKYDVVGRDVIVKYTGPAHLVNNPTQPHYIDAKDTDGALLLPDGNFRMSVFHPGTRGKRFFERAREIVRHEAPRLFQREAIREPLRKVFH